MQALRTVYRGWAWIVFVAVIVQVGLAGYGAFYAVDKADDAGKGTVVGDKVTHGFGPHSGLGYFIFFGTIVYFLLALGARLGKRRILLNLGLVGLLMLQIVLAWIGGGVPGLGFLHPVNALVIFAFTGWLAHSAWREQAAPRPMPASAPAP